MTKQDVIKKFFIDSPRKEYARVETTISQAIDCKKEGTLDEVPTPDEVRDYIGDEWYKKLCNSDVYLTSSEKEEWRKIVTDANNANSSNDLSKVLASLNTFRTAHPWSHQTDADDLEQMLTSRLGNLPDPLWDNLDKTDYHKMRTYKKQNPTSPFLRKLDDYMWNAVKKNPSDFLPRYIEDWGEGKYIVLAQQYDTFRSKWIDFKNKTDKQSPLKSVSTCKKEYIDNEGVNKDNPFYGEVSDKYEELRTKAKDFIKTNPGKCLKSTADDFIKDGIFTLQELIETGRLEDKIWKELNAFSDDKLPWRIKAKQGETSENMLSKPYVLKPDTDLRKYEGASDIYFFGVPETGKSCVLMGLAGLNGEDGFRYNSTDGGQYLHDLRCFLDKCHTPGSTEGNFAAVIQATITEKNTVHKFNLIEMAGEDFRDKLTAAGEDAKVAFNDMGLGVERMLNNKNRKVFFFVIDPTQKNIQSKDDKSERPQPLFLETFADKVVSQRPDILEKVDAIHIIVAKSDTLKEKSLDGFIDKNGYRGAKKAVENLGKWSKLVGFSIGKFFIGDIFEYDKTCAKVILNLIKDSTIGYKKPNAWTRFLHWLHTAQLTGEQQDEHTAQLTGEQQDEHTAQLTGEQQDE